MKKSLFIVLTTFLLGTFLGFTNNDKPGKTPFDYSGPALETKITQQETSDHNPISSSGVIYYTDDFNGANDTTSLKARGYLVYYRGTGAQGVAATWFQGNSTVFSAFNGPVTGYVGANYQVVGGLNNIDSWMVLPDLDVVIGDEIRFQCRSVTGGTFPDSVRVMYNDQGGTTPESPGWVELGRFQAAFDGSWELKSFVAPTSGLSARFAIRYAVVDGGPNGANSDYIGIDALEVEGQGLLPVELSSFVSLINQNNVTLNWSTASEINNSGFEIERSNFNGQASNDWIKVGSVNGNGTSSSSHSYTFTERNLISGVYNYRLKQIDFNGNFEYYNLSSEVNIGVPVNYDLSQNYPNPFNPSTKINFEIPSDGKVSLKVFDLSGKEVADLVNEVKTAGYYSYSFNASGLSSGIYFYNLTSNNFTATKKMMLVK
ncbi:MAG: choice-of-anchor J domain-containing protein [Ignavibacteria bacterium]